MSVSDGFSLWIGKQLAEIFLFVGVLVVGVAVVATWSAIQRWLDK